MTGGLGDEYARKIGQQMSEALAEAYAQAVDDAIRTLPASDPWVFAERPGFCPACGAYWECECQIAEPVVH